MSAPSEGISLDHQGSRSHIAVLTLNRPERNNAFNVAMARRMRDTLRGALSDRSVAALVITGAGQAFSPGADAADALELARSAAEGRHPPEPFDGLLGAIQEATLALYRSSKPTVAAINGAAAAGALDLALACDFRIGTAAARFAESYVKLGLPPLNASAWLLVRAIGEAQTLRLLLSGAAIDGTEALRLGIVHELAAEGQILQRAIQLAESVAEAPATLTEFIKSEVYRARSSDLADAQSRAFMAGVAALNAPEYQNAVHAALARHRR